MAAHFDAVSRGVTRLDAAWDNKQVWRPRIRAWGLSEANLLLKKVLATLLGLFCARGIAPPCPIGTPLAVRLFMFVLILWTLQPHFTLRLSARTLQCLFEGVWQWCSRDRNPFAIETWLKFRDETETSSKRPRLKAWGSRPRLETTKCVAFCRIFF